MLVVHGGWHDGRLVLWAEDTGRATADDQKQIKIKIKPHRYAAEAHDLANALPAAGEETTLPIALPSSTRHPLPSPESGIPLTARTPRLTRWSVPALLVTPADALPFLRAETDGTWAPAESLRYLGAVAELAEDLVRRGRMLPQLVGDEARWRAVLTGADAAAFRMFAQAMPPSCRALGETEKRADDVLRQALDLLVDAAARVAFPERLLLGHRPGSRAPLADRWMVALAGDDPALPGARRTEAEALRTALTGWFDAAQAANGPARVSFRLDEPVQGADEWWLEFALQSTEDPAHSVAAEDVFEGAAPWPRADETLLAGLGRAVRLFPALYESLRKARPDGLELDTAGAFNFLSAAAPLLQAAGYGVQLPSWAGKRGLGLKLTAKSKKTKSGPKAVAAQGFGMSELVDYRLDLMVGDEAIDAAELERLALLKVPLIRVRGRWVELDDRQLKAALKAVGRRREGELTAADVLALVVDGGEPDLPIVDVDVDGPLGDLLSGQAADRLTPIATPDGFAGTLRPYQERGLSWLSFLSRLGLGGILADDMGLGKTAQTLSLLVSEKSDDTGPTLLICPMSLVSNWRKEAERFAPGLTVHVHHGAGRDPAALAKHDLVITTYGTALRDLELLREQQWERVVCDEAQALKNSGTRQAQAARAIPARTRLALSGTPVENHLAELWSLLEFCNPGMLGTAKHFRSRYQEPIEARQDEYAAAALKRATGPFVLRRLKTDRSIITDLPEKLEVKVWCTLTPEQATLYAAVVEEMMATIASTTGIERRGNVLAAMTRLKQVCNHPAHLLKDGSALPGRSGKLDRLESLCEEIVADGEKGLVFTQYAEFGALLQPYLQARLGRPVLWLHGGLTKARRDELVETFQTGDEPTIFLLSLKAAGTGLNLTAANHVVHVDRWWNPAVEDQATDRAYRIGQRKNVQVRKFICTGTLEERIDEMIERKKSLAESVVGTGEEWITDLSTDALRDLFALDPAGVA
ncbi:DEAD/DEAH box helicase [Catenuloplanes japonicus]|uniref:DEAD/DEAH box helicase n=1 Tax=Catenuloplanes japonicus TaxID=33876 RepID=UPI000525673D|nr:DEAD/DEAH box helicase [Catenuloplanes japonicus]